MSTDAAPWPRAVDSFDSTGLRALARAETATATQTPPNPVKSLRLFARGTARNLPARPLSAALALAFCQASPAAQPITPTVAATARHFQGPGVFGEALAEGMAAQRSPSLSFPMAISASAHFSNPHEPTARRAGLRFLSIFTRPVIARAGAVPKKWERKRPIALRLLIFVEFEEPARTVFHSCPPAENPHCADCGRTPLSQLRAHKTPVPRPTALVSALSFFPESGQIRTARHRSSLRCRRLG